MVGKIREYHKDDLHSGQSTGRRRIVFAAAVLLVIICIIFIVGTGILKTGNNGSVSMVDNGCTTPLDQNGTGQTPLTTLPVTDLVTPTPLPEDIEHPGENLYGKLNVSTGNFPGYLPVSVDGILTGTASSGNPLSLNVSEGSHVVRICSGTVCEKANVHIGYAITTSLNFEKLLTRDVPLGSLNISSGDYPATLPVFIDDENAGNISTGKFFNSTQTEGMHAVAICAESGCINTSVIIVALNQTSLDYTDQLKNDLPKGNLVVSIGGFDANLPVFIDNTSVGNVSLGNPLNLKLDQGNHTVAVCAGKVCENESVQIRFAKQSFVDFGEQLIKDVEFTTPTARIKSSFLNGATLTVGVVFINPDSKDHVISATISCVYSYSDYSSMRHSDSAQNRISVAVKSGGQSSQNVSLSLPGGSNVIANDPVVMDIAVS